MSRPLTWDSCNTSLQGRNYWSRKLGNNTYLTRDKLEEDVFRVRLHNTYILSFEKSGRLTVTTGGWWTPTTRARINWLAPVAVWGDRGGRYIQAKALSQPVAGERNEIIYKFYDGMQWEPATGQNVAGWLPVGEAEVDDRPGKRLRLQATKYANAFAGALEVWDGDRSLPDGKTGVGLQDCLSCYLSMVGDEKPIWEEAADNIREHMSDLQFIASWLPAATGMGWWELVGTGRGMKARRKRAAGLLRDWLVGRIEELEKAPALDPEMGPWTGGVTAITGK